MAAESHPLAAIAGIEFAAWGDIDNDGRVDALLCRADGAPVLMRQMPGGVWKPVDSAALGTVAGTRDCMLVDIDHDGDLDILLVGRDGGRQIFANKGDGTFRSLAGRLPASRATAPAVQLVAADLDNDRDLDLVVLHPGGRHEVLANDLMWTWHAAAGFDAFATAPIVALAAADLDARGEIDLVALAADGSIDRWRRAAGRTWTSQRLAIPPGPAAARGRTRLALADLDGDGRMEILVGTATGVAALRQRDDGWEAAAVIDEPEIAGWSVATLDRSGPALVVLRRDGSAVLHPAGPGRYGFARIALSGRNDPAATIRSNASGIGARLAARVGGRWVAAQALRESSGPGQSLTPVAIGLAGTDKPDSIRIDWSDGVLQTEFGASPPAVQQIVETQRQLSSCPLIFAWDGQRFAFVSDFLGVGGLGYLVAPGQYATPRPWENFLLPAGLPAARAGRLTIKIGEPMEEAAYIDSVRLVAYDLPPEWSMVLDERMQIGPPAVTGRPLFYRAARVPIRAVNDRGEEVTAAIRTADRVAADPGAVDPRYIGRLAGEHVLTLDFESDLDAPGAPLAMLADGWIEYPYSQTMFAAWQADAGYDAPSLEARGRDGRWRTVLEHFGYPAGMPRTMAVPLPRLPAGTRSLRLRTNQEIYWDRIALVQTAPLAPAVHPLRLAAATVGASGFPFRSTGRQRLPDYDYARRSPLWDTRVQPGQYTEFGDALALLAAADGALAIIGPGEEIHLEFDAALPALPDGWTRRYVLETRGWAKDMDLYTRDGASLAPVPGPDRLSADATRLNRRYNRREAEADRGLPGRPGS